MRACVAGRPPFAAPEKTVEGFDGETFVFSMPAKNHGEIAAQIWSPTNCSKMANLTNLANALAKYAKKKISEDDLNEALAAAE